MRTLLSILFGAVLFLYSCGSHSANNTTYEQKKSSLQQQEKNDPADFLTVTIEYHVNLVGQWVVSGSIHNKSTLTSYTNITVRLSYLNKAGTVIAKEDRAFDDTIQPNSSITFKSKSRAPKETYSVSAKIVSADTK